MNHTEITKTISELEEKIQASENEIVRLKKEYKKLTPEITIANLIHGKMCHWNHIDGCGYEYESQEKFHDPNSTKGRYYQKAVAMLNSGAEYDKIIEILEIL